MSQEELKVKMQLKLQYLYYVDYRTVLFNQVYYMNHCEKLFIMWGSSCLGDDGSLGWPGLGVIGPMSHGALM